MHSVAFSGEIYYSESNATMQEFWRSNMKKERISAALRSGRKSREGASISGKSRMLLALQTQPFPEYYAENYPRNNKLQFWRSSRKSH